MLWNAVAAGLIGPDYSALAVTWEVVIAVLETGDAVAEEDVRALVQAVVTESGWRVAGRRELAESDTSALFFAVQHAMPQRGAEQRGHPGPGLQLPVQQRAALLDQLQPAQLPQHGEEQRAGVGLRELPAPGHPPAGLGDHRLHQGPDVLLRRPRHRSPGRRSRPPR